MKSNGHSNDKHQEVEHTRFARPNKPVPRFVNFKPATSNAQKALKFWKSKPWDEWWDEFNEKIDKQGRPVYRTVGQFVRAKAKNQYERDLMLEMIGPEPPEEKSLRAPWLGDWQLRRANGFKAYDDEKYESIKQALHERVDALEAAKAVAPLTVPFMKRWNRLADKVDEIFGGQPFNVELGPTHPENIKRFKAYVEMHREVERGAMRMWNKWMKAHGMDPNPHMDAQQWVTMAALAAGKAGAAGALTGVAAAGGQFQEWDLMFAKDLREKAEMYPGLTLPDVAGEPVTKTKQ